jgi:DNA-binding NtrC family response regulator
MDEVVALQGLAAHPRPFGVIGCPFSDSRETRPASRPAQTASGLGFGEFPARPYTSIMSRACAFLVVDDDPDVLKAAGVALARVAEHVELAPDADRLEAILATRPYDALLLDMNFAVGDRSGEAGFDALSRAQTTDPALGVVLMTTFAGVSLAVRALKRGASDFIMKPWRNDDLLEAMRVAADQTRLRREGQTGLNLDDLEKRAIERALRLHQGNISQAAAALGLTRPALYRRMERHGL